MMNELSSRYAVDDTSHVAPGVSSRSRSRSCSLLLHVAEEGVPALGDDAAIAGVGEEHVRPGVGALVPQGPGDDAELVPRARLGEVGEGDGHVDGDLEVLRVGDGGRRADLVHQGHHGAGGQAARGGVCEVVWDGVGAADEAWLDAEDADPSQRQPLEEACHMMLTSIVRCCRSRSRRRRVLQEGVEARAVVGAHRESGSQPCVAGGRVLCRHGLAAARSKTMMQIGRAHV